MYLTQSQLTPAKEPRRVLKGGVSTTAPQPGLGSGSSPPAQVRFNASPKFGSSVGLGTIIGPNALSQCFTDILGVWVPKLPLVRSKAQFFEETFLEFVEDGAFYFAVPVAAYALQKLPLLNKGHSAETIGKGLTGNMDGLTRKLVASKFGTLAGALAIAGAVEYMIQHAKNVITAKQFKTKNFTAVAGLEGAQDKAAYGEMDPVDKAKRRAWQVPLLFGSVLAAALVSPRLIMKNDKLAAAAKKTLSYIDFGKSPFDISKSILGILAAIGAVSYVDAARDSLERKETATRLAVVIPYMLFGKELAGFALAKYYENFGKIKVGNEQIKLSDLKKTHQFSLTNGNNPFKQFLKKETFLDMGVLHKDLAPIFEELAKKGKPLNYALVEGLSKISNKIGLGSYLLSAAISGVGINWIAYQQTKERFRRQQEEQLRSQQQVPLPAKPTFQSGFGVPAQPVTAPGFGGAPQASPFAFPGNLQGQAGQFNRFSYR
ncbi:MAG: hypothetical protein K0Q50_3002 [Vampirovibrio sp.]|jgi:hypothetical protein|nr:hypothetical protein [Vampirovibrio sp.]